MTTLRQYQQEIIEIARSRMQAGDKTLLIVAPTGSGKTLLTAHMLKTAASKNFHCWFLVHRRELIDQSIAEFNREEINFGIIANGYQGNSKAPIQIGSTATVMRRFRFLPKPQMIIWDEAHHVAAKTWKDLFEAFPDIFHIGLTATPQRLDGKGLGKFFKVMIEGPTVAELIEQGFLCPYKLFAPPGQTFDDIGKRYGDYKHNEVVGRVNRPQIIGNIVEHYKKNIPGKQAIVFCVSIGHSQETMFKFCNAGVNARHLDGKIRKWERDNIVKLFREKKIQILCNVDLFSEGFDVPNLDAVILARPTLSLSLHRQQIGRALRPFPGKPNTIILDHVGNVMRHGLPCEPIKWSLEGNATRESIPSIRICPQCYYANPAGTQICEDCGHEFTSVVNVKPIIEGEGNLEEVNLDEMREKKKQELRQCRSYEDFVQLGRIRGYRDPMGWAWHRMRERQMWKMRRNTG